MTNLNPHQQNMQDIVNMMHNICKPSYVKPLPTLENYNNLVIAECKKHDLNKAVYNNADTNLQGFAKSLVGQKIINNNFHNNVDHADTYELLIKEANFFD